MATCLWLAAKSHAWPRLHRGATWPHTCAHTPVDKSTEAWVYSSLTFHIKVASIVILPCLSVCLCTKRKYFLDLFFLNDGYLEITHYQVLFQSGRDNEMYPHGNLILLWDCIEKKKKESKVSVVTQLLPNYQSFRPYHSSVVMSSHLQLVLFSHVCLFPLFLSLTPQCLPLHPHLDTFPVSIVFILSIPLLF